MKKRVLSMLLAFILCFSTLPMTAFAQETDAVVEQEEQQEADSAEGQEEQQEADSAEEQEEQQEADSAEQQGADSAEGQERQQEAAPVTEQKEAEAAAAPGEETPSDKSTTAGEAPDTVNPSAESVSDNDAGTQDTGADDEKKAAVQKVQALINALPEEVTAKNADELQAQLMAIEEALAALNDEQRAELDMTRLENICAALNGAVAVQATHTNHTDSSMNEWKETNALPDVAGSYYLSQNVTLDKTWTPADGTVLCLNGHSITMNEDNTAVITIESGVTFTLYDDCSDTGNGKITHGTNGTTGSKYTGRGVSVEGTFNMYGGEITGNETHEITVGGGGVYVAKNGVLNMSGSAVISGNTVYKGTASSAGSGGGVNVNGGTFNMNGGTISNNTADIYGSGVYVDAKGVFKMSGGTITENLRNGGVALSDASTFNMYDTAVISNNEHGADGGGVYVRSSIFNMYGGTIIGNRVTSSANDGGGVALMGTGSIFTMYGGSIVGNETLRSGGGVYVDNQNVFYMQGGTITGNNVNGDSDDSTYKKYYNGGGVFVGGGYKDSSSTYISATFKVSGSARITGNTKGATTKDDKTGCYTGGTSNNVFLLKYNDNAQQATITIADTLTDGASIGVLTGKMPDEDSNVTFATAATGYTLTEEDADCFTSDADDIYPIFADGKVQMSKTAPHRHYLCGEEHHVVGDHTTDSQMTFTKLWMDADGKLKIGDTELTATITQDKGYFDQGQNVTCYELPAGNYYLGSSITLDYPIYIASYYATASKDVKLCLNGKTIKANGNFSAIVCSSNLSKTTFTLTDCQQKAGTITHAAGKTGSGVLLYSSWTESNGNGTRFNMYGGNITGNTAEYGGGVYIERAKGEGGIFNLYGGVISGNKANGAGGGVGTSGRYSAFTMYDGEITNNTAGKDGGGVSSASAKFIMNGGSITGNTAATGGGVSVGCYGSTDFTMNGGKIKNNTASTNGGGVYMVGKLRSYTFTLNGTPDISENTKDGVANNVYLSSGAVITVGNLDANTQIPVTLEKMPTKGFYVKFAEAGMGVELNDPIAHQFIIENDGSNGCDKKIIENEPNELWLYVTGDKLHQHAICGEFCDHEPNHSKELWTPLTYNADTQQLMYGSLPVPSAVKEIGAADDQGNPTKAYYTTYKLPAGNYYLADTIDMKGGSTTYKGNEVTSKGGVLEIETDVNLCLNGKRLVTSAPHVGVIVIQKAGTLTLSDCGTDGEIRSSCNAFAGVQIANDTSQAGTFTMYDGAIKYTATGVLMGSNSIFNMYGGTIANNETGVSVVSTSKLTVGGSADITGNDNENVFLNDKAMITIDSSLKNSASIGVTTEKAPTDETPIQIATGATGWVLYTEIFKPDGTNQGYVVTENDRKLYLNSHIHNWIYDLSATRQTITANCNVTGCPKPDGGWVTIDKPKHEVYGDGKSAEATLNVVNWQPDAVTVSNIKYEQPGKPLSEAPTDAGTYWASITIGNATAGVRYTINSKKVTDPTIEVADVGTYDGTEKKPSVVVKDGEKVIPDSEYSVSYADNINAGTATVTITDVAGGNYDVSGSTTFTINKGAYNGTVEKKVTIIKKRSTAQTGTLTAADFFPEGAVPEGAVISNVNGGFDSDVMNPLTLDQDAGKISYITAANITSTTDQTCKVIISSTNYENIEATLTFHPTDKMTVTIDGLTYTGKTYDGSAIQPSGTLTVSDDKVLVDELEVLYEGTSANGTNYSSSDAPKDAGTYKVTYKVGENNENYTGEVTYTFTISQKNVTKDMIGAIAAQEYTGSAITPELVVKDGGVALILGTDFDLKYDNNTNAGTATLTITGKGNYKGTADKTFTIERKNIAGAVIELEQSELRYNGSTQTVKIKSVTVGGRPLASGDYSIINGSDMFMSAKDSIPLTIEGRGNYTGTATTTWKITKIDPVLDNFVVTSDLSTAQTYDGTPKAVTVQTNAVTGMGAVKVYYEGIDGTTYTRSETAPTNVGSYKVILTVAEGTNYKAATDLTKDDWAFTIQPATLTVIPTAGQSKTYGDRDPVAFSYEVSGEKFNDKPVFTGTLGRAEGKNAGTYAITLGTLALKDGANFLAKNYKLVLDETTVNFTINPKILHSTDLEPLGSTVTKVYDGTTKVNELNVVVDSDSMAAGDAEIKVTGTAVYNSANVADAKSVIFTPDAITTGNYRLAATEQLEVSGMLSVAITPATITVTPDAGQTKIYGAKDPELTYTYSGEILGEKPLFTGALGREAGENVGSYVIKQGTLALMDNSDGKFSAGNYTLKLSDTPVNFVITKAPPEIKVEEKTLVKNGNAVDISTWASFNNTDTDAKLVYTLVGAPAGISLTENNLLTAENADTTAESFNIVVTADATTNFTAPEQKQFTVQVVEKADAGVKIDAPTSKTYGDADFTLQASATAADNGTWSWTSSNEAILKIVSGAETAAPVIRVVKADATGATLTVTYISDAYYGMASVTITVNPKTVTAAMIGEMKSREYNGGAIMPTPEVKDGEAILTPGGDFEFGYSGNTNAGTATLTITGKGNYKGTADKTFTIERKDITGAVIELEQSELRYNGSTQTVKIKSVTVGGRPLASGDYSIINGSDMFMSANDSITLTIAGKGNYTGTAATTWKITKIDPVRDNFVVTPGLSTEQTYDGTPKAVTVQTKDVIGMGAVKVYYEGSTGTDYTKSETAPVNAGTYQVTLEVLEGTNYNAAQLVVGTMKINKAVLILENIEKKYGFTESGEQTISIAGCVPDATGYTLGTVTGNTEIISGASVDQDGNLKFTLNEGKAGKKLTLPVTISSANYKDTTVNVVIIQEYRIIDGANSSWTQNTDGTIVIRGNGEFSMFHAVKVDGKVIDPANYEAKEGSTIITLKAEYLKTLAAGSHTFEIVWTDGSAGTDFTVVVNTPSNNGNSSNNDSSDSSNTTDITVPTAAATAQELDKVPATGDPFGIWLTLFAISLTGLSVMLVRRKKG